MIDLTACVLKLVYRMCSKASLLVFIVQLLIKCSYGLRTQQDFRRDYKYLEPTESFYKIHTTKRTWFEAKKICANEGTKLFFPENQDEANIVLTYLNETHGFKSIFIGISDLVAEGDFATIDGRSIFDVYHKWGPGEPNNVADDEDCVQLLSNGAINDYRCSSSLPFICKKTLASIQWNKFCNMPFLDYTYNEKMDKCYKFHSNAVNWTDAHTLCTAELSYLAVINGQNEADYLTQLVEENHKNSSGDIVRGAVLLGFHNQLDEGWTTVRGTLIEDSGYNKWVLGQPAGDARKKCGSMLYNGLLNPIGCEKRSFFVCEHDIHRPASLDIRFEEESKPSAP